MVKAWCDGEEEEEVAGGGNANRAVKGRERAAYLASSRCLALSYPVSLSQLSFHGIT